jgi:uncharacterized protein YjiS (DUF1127 family)
MTNDAATGWQRGKAHPSLSRRDFARTPNSSGRPNSREMCSNWRKAMNRHMQTWVAHWQRLMRNRRTQRELDAFSPAERRHLAEDVGLSGTDLRRFNCTHDGPSELMPARLRELGIDPAFVKYQTA